MPKAKQITAWVENKPGELGRIAEALGKAKLNITAFSGCSTTGESPVHLLVSSPAKAKRCWRASASAAPKRRSGALRFLTSLESSGRPGCGSARPTLMWTMVMEASLKAVRRPRSCWPSLISRAPQRPCAVCDQRRGVPRGWAVGPPLHQDANGCAFAHPVRVRPSHERVPIQV